MANNYIGEVRLVGFSFAPAGWAFCQGQALSISQNSPLFTLIGTTYGGDGVQSFNLPNLQGRIPIHQGQLTGGGVYVIGQTGGVENVTITPNTYPTHNHALSGSANPGNLNAPGSNVVGKLSVYSALVPGTPMSSSSLGLAPGGNQPHNNLQPFQVLNWIIALEGIYPSQT